MSQHWNQDTHTRLYSRSIRRKIARRQLNLMSFDSANCERHYRRNAEKTLQFSLPLCLFPIRAPKKLTLRHSLLLLGWFLRIFGNEKIFDCKKLGFNFFQTQFFKNNLYRKQIHCQGLTKFRIFFKFNFTNVTIYTVKKLIVKFGQFWQIWDILHKHKTLSLNYLASVIFLLNLKISPKCRNLIIKFNNFSKSWPKNLQIWRILTEHWITLYLLYFNLI